MKTLKKIRDSSSYKIGAILLLSVLTVWSMISMNIVNVFALNRNDITETWLPYNTNYINSDGSSHFGQMQKLMVNGKYAFCVQPNVPVGNGDGYTNNTHAPTTVESKIMYHGFYNTSMSDYDYAVTFNMIQEQHGAIVTSTTIPNYDGRKAEIMALVNSHNLRPDFNTNSIEINLGESITLTDNNNVISQMYIVRNTANIDYRIEGNKLIITPKIDSNEKGLIQFEKYRTKSDMNYLYSHPNKQDLLVGGAVDPITLAITLKINKYGTGKLIWNKTANVFTHTDTWQTEYGKAETPVYEVENILGSSIDIYTAENILYRDKKTVILPKETYVATLDSEYDSVALELIAGKYYYVEKDVPNNTILNTDKHYFTIEDTMTSGLSETHSTLHNEIPMITFDFTKKLESDYQTTGKEYQDVVFGIYARDKIYDYRDELAIFDNTLLATCGIDEDGHLKDIPILPIGNYFIKELGTNAAYELNTEEYDFSIDQSHDENVEIMINEGKPIVNQLKDFTLRLHKIDEKGNAIKNAPFAFARYEDKECTKLLDLGSVDLENGIQTFHSVHFGISYIKEIENPKGYQKSDHIMKIEVNENGVYVDDKKIEDQEDSYPIYFANDTIVEVKTGDITNMYPQMMIAGGSLIIIVGLSIFLRKKNTH